MIQSTDTASRASSRELAARILLAAFGGYLLTYALTALSARLLPLPATMAVLISTNLSFAVYPLVIIVVFARRHLASSAVAMAVITVAALSIAFELRS